MKKFFLIILIAFSIFLIIDYSIGKKILELMYNNNIILSPEMKKSEIDRIRSIEKSYRVKNKYFHHTLKPNIEIESTWGAVKYLVCTNKFGFRKNCNKKENLKNKKLILIGDSFTEGVGLNYKDTFAGMLDQSSKYEIINMGVTSYSPIIYFNKIKYYIDRGLKADHVIIFVDISDIDDEANYYTKCKNSDYVCDKKK